MDRRNTVLFTIPLRPRRLALGGVVLAALAVFLLCDRSSSEARVAPVPVETVPKLRLLLPDTFMVLHLNVPALLKNELTRPVADLMAREGRGKAEDYGLREFGARLSDIKSVVLIGNQGHLLTLVTTQRPLDRDAVIKALVPNATPHNVKDRTIHIGEDSFRKTKRFPDEDIKDRKDAPPRQPRFDDWSPAVLFLNDRTYIRSQVAGLKQYVESAVKVDEKHPLAAALAKAGNAHLTLGFGFPETIRDDMQRELRWALRHQLTREPVSAMTLAAFRPILLARSSLLTVDLGDSSRAELTVHLENARAVEKGRAAGQFTLQMLKGGVSYFEDEMLEELLGSSEKAPGSKLLALLDGVRESLDNGSVKVEGNTVKIAVKVRTESDTVKAVWAELKPRIEIASQRSIAMNNFKQVAIALHNYADSYEGRLPPAVLSKDGKPLFSWRVALLPFLEEDALYKGLKLDEPWNSEHNKKILDRVGTPKVYQLPDVKTADGHTFMQFFTGPGTMFPDGKDARFRLGNMPDGTTNTIAVVEAAESVHWAAPGDITASPRISPLKQMGNRYGKGPLVAMWDGSVRFISRKVKETTLRHAIDPQDGNVLEEDWDDDEPGKFRGRKPRYKDREFKDKIERRTDEPPSPKELPPPPKDKP